MPRKTIWMARGSILCRANWSKERNCMRMIHATLMKNSTRREVLRRLSKPWWTSSIAVNWAEMGFSLRWIKSFQNFASSPLSFSAARLSTMPFTLLFLCSAVQKKEQHKIHFAFQWSSNLPPDGFLRLWIALCSLCRWAINVKRKKYHFMWIYNSYL